MTDYSSSDKGYGKLPRKKKKKLKKVFGNMPVSNNSVVDESAAKNLA